MRNFFIAVVCCLLVPSANARDWPLVSGAKSDVYGAYRNANTDLGSNFHSGVDIAGPADDPVFAVVGGTVALVSYNAGGSGYDARVVIQISSGVYNWYEHVTPDSGTVENIFIQQDAEIGTIIDSSTAAGLYHVHFAVTDGPYNPDPSNNPLGHTAANAIANPFDGTLLNRTHNTPNVDNAKFYTDDYDKTYSFVDSTKNILAGRVDIAAHAYEPTVAQSTSGVTLNAGIHSIGYQIQNKTTGSLYPEWLMLGTTNGFDLERPTVPVDTVYSFNKDALTTDADPQTYWYIVTNNTDPSGDKSTLNKQGAWNTKSLLSDNKQLSPISALAKYPDGNYTVKIRAAGDKVGSGYEYSIYYTTDVIVDNFRPYLESLTVSKSGVTKYSRSWSFDGTQLNSPVPADTKYIGAGDYTATLKFSEPVSVPTATLGALGSLQVSSTTDSNSQIYTGTISLAAGAVVSGTYTFTVDGFDLANNRLLPLANSDVAITTDQISRNASGVMGGAGGPDASNNLLVDVTSPTMSLMCNGAAVSNGGYCKETPNLSVADDINGSGIERLEIWSGVPDNSGVLLRASDKNGIASLSVLSSGKILESSVFGGDKLAEWGPLDLPSGSYIMRAQNVNGLTSDAKFSVCAGAM